MRQRPLICLRLRPGQAVDQNRCPRCWVASVLGVVGLAIGFGGPVSANARMNDQGPAFGFHQIGMSPTVVDPA
jgi:hypothetical protein